MEIFCLEDIPAMPSLFTAQSSMRFVRGSVAAHTQEGKKVCAIFN